MTERPAPTAGRHILALTGMDHLDLLPARERLAIVEGFLPALEWAPSSIQRIGKSWSFKTTRDQVVSLNYAGDSCRIYCSPRENHVPFFFDWPAKTDHGKISEDAATGHAELRASLDTWKGILAGKPVQKSALSSDDDYQRHTHDIAALVAALLVQHGSRPDKVKAIEIRPPSPWSNAKILDFGSGVPVIPQKIATQLCAALPTCIEIKGTGANYQAIAVNDTTRINLPELDTIAIMRTFSSFPPQFGEATALAPRLRKKAA